MQIFPKKVHSKTQSSPLLELAKARSSFDLTTKGIGKIKRTQVPFDLPFPANAGRNSLVQFLTDKSEQESRKAKTDQKIKETEP